MIDIKEKLSDEIKKGEDILSGDRITVGLATCGISAGGMPVFEALNNADLNIAVEKVGCAGMCYCEPIVTVVKDGKKTIYGYVTKDNVNKLIESIKSGQENEELKIANELEDLDFYKKQHKVVMANSGIISPLNLGQYIAKGGYEGLTNAVKEEPNNTIEKVKNAGLRGRGGAGFSTGMKWSFIAPKTGKKYLVCNGDEGDPGAFMNRTVLESDPFKVIEGMTIGAYTIGSDEGIIYTRAEYPLAINILQNAINIAYENNLLGQNIMGIEGFNFDLRIQKGAGAFVCGEETALLNSAEGKRGMPNPRPPFPTDKGLFGKPTVINNVETWTHVSKILGNGVEEFTKIGSEKSKGTKVICLAGKIKRPGVVEVPIGLSMKELIYEIGGGCENDENLKAVLTGGPAGGCVPAAMLDTPLDYENLQALGSIMGSGGFVVLTDKDCMVDVARYFMNFSQEESCGKCTPCREGTKRLLDMLTDITRGNGTEEDIEKIQQLAEFVRDTALCGLGQNAPNPIISTLKHFKDEYIAHVKDYTCPSGACANLLTFTINDKCIGCGNCARHCPVGCISGKLKEAHVIDQEKCIKCGACVENCAFSAIDRK